MPRAIEIRPRSKARAAGGLTDRVRSSARPIVPGILMSRIIKDDIELEKRSCSAVLMSHRIVPAASGRGRYRTCDLLLVRQTLSPLSYAPGYS